MFARFDENPAMTLQDIKETKSYGQTDARTDNVKTVYPPQTKFAGGIKIENLKKEVKMRVNTLIFIYTIHFAYLKVYTKFHNPKLNSC